MGKECQKLDIFEDIEEEPIAPASVAGAGLPETEDDAPTGSALQSTGSTQSSSGSALGANLEVLSDDLMG